ncbi:NAD(P)H-quinone oxidoreductase [Lacisediminimonas sp.]|uniref:NAD(P)H-quinone oxidoreductase n=1 Tax=Lacisediminimonas sp. TaxID=3060582 RepID=UPI002724CC4B|nr:NAD(P)H-quinone oxidoreductase [Lacisediminimonas sp.]MDO8299179.1 NAD(P)H-quinone oxidoreductase [Lacisediminimonas sp.]MDO9218399.1 NAD(P)H-quinone oxidoreductase [Lacisediminimonas sp.]
MRAIEIVQPGGPEVLQICERPMPVLKAGEVLIKVHAAGVNRPDVFQRTGNYPVPPGASDLPGLEVSGEIVDGDLSGSGLRKGDMVCALVQGGGYAEYCTAPLEQCLPVPKGLDAVEAASLPETFFTVWSNVFDRGALAEGEVFLVQGGTSGIGVTAIQLVSAMGHRVFATAGSDEKCRACESLGAERGINYKTEDFSELLKAATNGRGVDVILDMVGGEYINREIRCLADDGRIVLIALLGGSKAQVDLGHVLRRRLTITGSTLRPRPVAFKAAIGKKLLQHAWPMLESGRIKPVIYKTFPLEQASAAHALMESSTHVGKIMLKVQ